MNVLEVFPDFLQGINFVKCYLQFEHKAFVNLNMVSLIKMERWYEGTFSQLLFLLRRLNVSELCVLLQKLQVVLCIHLCLVLKSNPNNTITFLILQLINLWNQYLWEIYWLQAVTSLIVWICLIFQWSLSYSGRQRASDTRDFKSFWKSQVKWQTHMGVYTFQWKDSIAWICFSNKVWWK